MQFHFDPNQQFQIDAIQAVTDLFDGQPDVSSLPPTVDMESGVTAVGNSLALDYAALLQNLQTVQQGKGLVVSTKLEGLQVATDLAATALVVDVEGNPVIPNYSVEMETGTGKTYVYLRTIFHLHQQYGYSKFIIIVPSVAVREGVVKSLQLTESHMMDQYGIQPYNYFAYSSANLAAVRNFPSTQGIEVMVITLAAFNKDSNILNQSRDQMERPIRYLQAANPILILDEPQNMEGEAARKAIASLNPLFVLRYSATHRESYNLVYRLTPYQAYREGLVKRIEVASVLRENDPNRALLRLVKVEAKGNKIAAYVEAYQRLVSNQVQLHVFKLEPDDDLEEKSKNPLYRGYVVTRINRGGSEGDLVEFGTLKLTSTQPFGADRKAIIERQVRYAVEEHFRKQATYLSKGIKVLTLFFIDKVDNYTEPEGLIRTAFERAYSDLQAKSPFWQSRDLGDVHKGYFAKRRRAGVDEYIDSDPNKDTAADNEAYELIMRDKERLLDLNQPTAFIFSHSALREGWDNPNVFQICTLNLTTSEVKKRQEIGRGMRLAVNQQGDRIKSSDLNVLTVIANESYETYVASLQAEIVAEYGKEGASPAPINASPGAPVVKIKPKLKQEKLLTPEFDELWQRISRKTRYAVTVDSDRLVAEVLKQLEEEHIHRARLFVRKAVVRVRRNDTLTAVLTGGSGGTEIEAEYELPNMIELINSLLEYSSPPLAVTRTTLVRLCIEGSETVQQMMLANPYQFAATVVRLLKHALAEQLVDGIKYSPIDEWYAQELFKQEENPGTKQVASPYDDTGNGAGLYDLTACDSDVEVKFAHKLEENSGVRLYIKLPAWFKVETPLGEYEPDWALVFEPHDEHGNSNQSRLYLMRETKSSEQLADLREEERWKVRCGLSHFQAALGVNYKVITDQSELPDGGWPSR